MKTSNFCTVTSRLEWSQLPRKTGSNIGGVNMAAIKHNLQRDLFKPSEERLYAVVSVTKAGKKKKASFLCVAGMNSVQTR